MDVSRYAAVATVVVALSRADQPSDLVSLAHRQLSQLFSAPITVFALLGDQQWTCEVRDGEACYQLQLPWHENGLSEQVLRLGPSLITDIRGYQAGRQVAVRNLRLDGQPARVRCYLGVPLGRQDSPAGILSLQHSLPGAFSVADLRLLRTLARHLSLALSRSELHRQLQQEARTDALTALGNRYAFEEAFAERRARGSLALVLLDITDFKAVNDSQGHAAGDRLLAEVGRLLREATPGSFRLGGDEFALLLDPGDLEEIMAALAASLQRFRSEQPWTLRLNAGAATLGADGTSREALYTAADRRMYQAKRLGVLWAPERPQSQRL